MTIKERRLCGVIVSEMGYVVPAKLIGYAGIRYSRNAGSRIPDVFSSRTAAMMGPSLPGLENRSNGRVDDVSNVYAPTKRVRLRFDKDVQ